MKLFFDDIHPLTGLPLTESDKILLHAEAKLYTKIVNRKLDKIQIPIEITPIKMIEMEAKLPKLEGTNLLKYSDPEDVKICMVQVREATRILISGINKFFGAVSVDANFFNNNKAGQLAWAYVADSVNRRLIWHPEYQKNYKAVIGGHRFNELLKQTLPATPEVQKVVSDSLFVAFHEAVLEPFWANLDTQIDRIIPKATWLTFLVLADEVLAADGSKVVRPNLYVGSDYRVAAWNINQE